MILLEAWTDTALTSSLLLAIPVAMLAGVVSFASPCVLPLLPGYLSYASGLGASRSPRERDRGGCSWAERWASSWDSPSCSS